MRIRRATADDADACVAILASLPEFFTPDTHDEVRQAIGVDPCWVAADDEAIVGFVAVMQRFPRAAEITFAAVIPERRGHGVGTEVAQRVLSELAADGVAIVEVKTLDASAGYEPYLATRAFWEARGFVQIDRIDPLPGWQSGNPAAIYACALPV